MCLVLFLWISFQQCYFDKKKKNSHCAKFFFFFLKKFGEVLQKWSFFLLKLTQWLKNLAKIAQLETYKIATHK